MLTHPILLASFPKSGSTYLGLAIEKYLQVPLNYLPSVDSLIHFIQHHGEKKTQPMLLHGHVFPIDQLINYLIKYQFKVVILERNILDCLVSIRDYLNKIAEGHIKHYQQQHAQDDLFVSRNLSLPQALFNAPVNEQLEYYIENSLSWYLNFHIAWQKKNFYFNKRLFSYRYEDLYADFTPQFRSLLSDLDIYQEDRFNGFTPPAKGQQHQGGNYNVGRSGRGEEALTPKLKSRIEKVITLYEKVSGLTLKSLIEV